MFGLILTAVLFAAVFAGLNRLRGTKDWREHLGWPGRSLYWVSAVIILAGVAITASWQGALLGVGYLIWGSLPWGHWQGLGHIPPEYEPDRAKTWFEREVEKLTDSKHLALYIRHVIALAPLTLAYPFVWQLFAPLVAAVQVALYELGWRVTPQKGTVTGEYLVGAYWGLLAWSIWL